jgi:hypothetical protein
MIEVLRIPALHLSLSVGFFAAALVVAWKHCLAC